MPVDGEQSARVGIPEEGASAGAQGDAWAGGEGPVEGKF